MLGALKTPDAHRVSYIERKCFEGTVEKKKSNKVDGEQALAVWKEYLPGKYKLPYSGGTRFLKAVDTWIKEEKTPLGLDLSVRPNTLNLIKDWLDEMKATDNIVIESPQLAQPAQPAMQLALRSRPRGDERVPKRQRTVLEIMTKADEDSRKTFEETKTRAQQMFDETMTKAEEEKLNTMAKAEEEVRRYLK